MIVFDLLKVRKLLVLFFYLQSLERCAYDHLTATYLLLGEKLCLHGYNISLNVSPLIQFGHLSSSNSNLALSTSKNLKLDSILPPKPNDSILTRQDHNIYQNLNDDLSSLAHPSALMELGIVVPVGPNERFGFTPQSSFPFPSTQTSTTSSPINSSNLTTDYLPVEQRFDNHQIYSNDVSDGLFYPNFFLLLIF